MASSVEKQHSQTADTSRQHQTTIGILGLLLGGLVLLVPVLVAPIPPIGDYPNHLARMWLLSSDAARTSMARFYHVQFDTFTNIAIDLIALTIGKLAGYQFAGRLSIALAVILPPMGSALLWWSINRRVNWWMLSFGLLAWGSTITNAFLNFQIAIGLALAFAALEPILSHRNVIVQLLVRALLSLALLLAHPFGLLLYLLLLVAIVVGPNLTLVDWRFKLARIVPAVVSTVSVALLFVLLVPKLPGAQEHSGLGTLGREFAIGARTALQQPMRKLVNVLFAIRAYNNIVDGLTLLALLLPVAWAAATRRLGVHAGLLLVSAVLLAAYFIVPDSLFGAGWVANRFAIMLAFALALSVVPRLAGWRGGSVAATLLLVFLGRTALIAFIWNARQADVASLASALDPVPAGSLLLSVENRSPDRKAAPIGRYTTAGENSFRHLPALALPWRHAFVPTIFSARGKQPLVTLPPWDALSEPNGGILPDIHALDPDPVRDDVSPEVEASYHFANYAAEWRKFDYLLLLNADVSDEYGSFTPPPTLTLVRDAGFAKLYRIAH